MTNADFLEADDDFPVLYVLMRSDVPDFVPGKAMAQANHAGTQFLLGVGDTCGQEEAPHEVRLAKMVRRWAEEADGFGTCIVLSVTYREMLDRIALAEQIGHFNGVVFDPTYPIRDGHRMQTLEVETCGWVFGMKSELEPLLAGLRLI